MLFHHGAFRVIELTFEPRREALLERGTGPRVIIGWWE
jgi:hypothetical protein